MKNTRPLKQTVSNLNGGEIELQPAVPKKLNFSIDSERDEDETEQESKNKIKAAPETGANIENNPQRKFSGDETNKKSAATIQSEVNTLPNKPDTNASNKQHFFHPNKDSGMPVPEVPFNITIFELERLIKDLVKKKNGECKFSQFDDSQNIINCPYLYVYFKPSVLYCSLYLETNNKQKIKRVTIIYLNGKKDHADSLDKLKTIIQSFND